MHGTYNVKLNLSLCRNDLIIFCAETSDVQTCFVAVPVYLKMYVTIQILKRIYFLNFILI